MSTATILVVNRELVTNVVCMKVTSGCSTMWGIGNNATQGFAFHRDPLQLPLWCCKVLTGP